PLHLLEPSIIALLYFINSFIDHRSLVGQSTADRQTKRDDQRNQLPDRLPRSSSHNLVELTDATAKLIQFFSLRFDLLTQGGDFRIKRCAHSEFISRILRVSLRAV